MPEKREVQIFGLSEDGAEVKLRGDEAGRTVVSPRPASVIGYETLSIAATALSLSVAIPDRPKSFVGVLETAQIRFRGDGTAPTSTTGTLMEVGDQIYLTEEQVENMQFIRTGGTSGVLNGHFYDQELRP